MVTQANAGLRWLTRATPDLDEARAAFTKIINSGHNASNVIDSIRTMFKKENSEGARVPVDINELIRQVLILAHDEQLKCQVSTRTALTRPLPEVTGDRVQLQQVILNLVKNAIEAMSSVTDRERVLRVKTEIDESGGVLVSIEDTGTGIDPKHIDRVSTRYSRRNHREWGWGSQFARRSSKPMMVAFGSCLISTMDRFFSSFCRREGPVPGHSNLGGVRVNSSKSWEVPGGTYRRAHVLRPHGLEDGGFGGTGLRRRNPVPPHPRRRRAPLGCWSVKAAPGEIAPGDVRTGDVRTGD
jgi:hypothetical protein